MVNITNAINYATLNDWVTLNLSMRNWSIPPVFNELVNRENHSELYSRGLYIHVQKNIESRSVYDNNLNPRVVNFAQTYMVKWGKFTDGILKRRKDDFASHYHYKEPNFPEIPNVAVRFQPYVLQLANPRPIVDGQFRSGSSSTLLHLISILDPTHENELGILVQSIFSPVGEFIRKERINIPIETIENEHQFLDDITRLFEIFENYRIL